MSLSADDRARRGAAWALVLATLFWGATFFLMKAGTVAIERHLAPGTGAWAALVFLMCRFALASLAFPLVFPWIRRAPRSALSWGVWAGIPFAGGFVLQIYGLREVDPSISALFTSMFVLFTPLLMLALFRKAPARNLVLGIGFAVGGLWLITGARGATLGAGEILSLLCALVFSAHIILTDIGTKRTDPIAMAWHSTTFAAVVCALPLAFVRPTPFAALPAILRERDALVGIAVTGLLATVGSIALMNRFQKLLSPNRAAVIYTMEPVFAGIFSWIFFGEAFGERKLMGGVLILVGNVICNSGWARRESQKP
ncbi:MAG: DMT family transporter [Planctomycetes bacterium]|nr:DMT family transporter [Planctomycetota bacterium]